MISEQKKKIHCKNVLLDFPVCDFFFCKLWVLCFRPRLRAHVICYFSD